MEKGILVRVAIHTGDSTTFRDYFFLNKKGDFVWGTPTKNGEVAKTFHSPHYQWISGEKMKKLIQGEALYYKGSTYRPISTHQAVITKTGELSPPYRLVTIE